MEEKAVQFRLLHRQGVQLVLGGGQAIEEPRQHLPVRAHLHVYPPQAVHDPVLAVQEDQVGAGTHALQHQLSLPRLSQLVHHVDGQGDHPLQGWLLDGGDAASGQVLAQEHAEHGGRRGVFPGNGGQMEPGLVGAGGEEELSTATEGQDHLIPAGLLDLLNPQSQQLLLELPDYGCEANGVKWHRRSPPS